LEFQGNNYFGGIFTYNGKDPYWTVFSGQWDPKIGILKSGLTLAQGSPTITNPAGGIKQTFNIGAIQINFQDATHGTMLVNSLPAAQITRFTF
jgi:hypothetical protein